MTYAAGPVSTRGRLARALSIAAPIVSAALLGFAFVAPPNWPAWSMFGFVTAALWLAWALWAWPLVLIAERTVIVRNALRTWAVPLSEVTGVAGGRKLTLSLSDGTLVTASAVTDGDLTLDVVRNVETYTEGGHFLRSADDLRLSANHSSMVDEWAALLRERVRRAPAEASGRIVRRLNLGVVLGTVAASALFIASFTVFG